MRVTHDIQASSSADIEQIHGMQTIVDAMDTISGLLSSLANSYRFVSAKDDQDSNCDHPSSSHTGAEMNRDYVPISKRLLLNFKEAAMLLSMSEASLRDLVHKGQGPENVRRGKRVCFTQEGLKKYVDGLPREYPYQDIIETINAKGSRPATIEEQRAFGV